MKIILPKPPTTNHIYGFTSKGGFARSYLTQKGKDWFLEAVKEIKKQTRKSTSIINDVEVWIMLYTSASQDVDGIIKPTLDSLGSMCLKCQKKFTSRTPCECGEKISLLKNDSQVYKVDVEKIKCKKGEDRLEIEIFGE